MKLTNMLALTAVFAVAQVTICDDGCCQVPDEKAPVVAQVEQAGTQKEAQPDETKFLEYLEQELQLARKEAKAEEARLAAQETAKKELAS